MFLSFSADSSRSRFSLSNDSDPMIEFSQGKNQALREKVEIYTITDFHINNYNQFQRKRVYKFCTRHKRQRRYFVFPPENEQQQQLFQHLIFNDKHNIVMCYVEQTQCSSDIASLLVQKSPRTPLYDTKDMRAATFANKSLTAVSKRKRIKEYYKTMFVRNPLERLLSSYLKLIEPPLTHLHDSFPNDVKIEILERYRSREYREWKATGMNYPLNVTFTEFVEYLIDKSSHDLNPHLKPMTDICHPCRIHYDFYGNSKRCNEDYDIIRTKIKPESSKSEGSYSSDNVEENLVKYFSWLPQRLKEKLIRKLHVDLDFYYLLYPEERYGHKILLSIRND